MCIFKTKKIHTLRNYIGKNKKTKLNTTFAHTLIEFEKKIIHI